MTRDAIHREDEPPSLWRAIAPPPPETAPLAGDGRVDVLVVGGGFTGLSTALHLAERGTDVAVLEARGIGFGASGRNNGQVIPCLSKAEPEDLERAFGAGQGARAAALIRDSAALVFDLVRRHGIDCDAEQTGWLQPAHSPGRVRVSERRCRAWQARGADVRLLDREQARAMLGSDAYHGAWLAPTGGHINPLGFARGLARAALAAGARIHNDSPVIGLVRDATRWRARTPGGTLSAERVVLATNAYSDALWPGLARSIVAVRSNQVATAPIGDNLRATVLPGRQAVSDTRGDLHFFRYTADHRLVTGAAQILPGDGRLRRRSAERLARLFPQLGRVPIDFAWSGSLAMTRDHLPHLHRPAPGVVAWLGCNGRGVALATALGPVLATATLESRDDLLPLPVTEIRPLPGHALLERVARLALMKYRWRDAREVG